MTISLITYAEEATATHTHTLCTPTHKQAALHDSLPPTHIHSMQYCSIVEGVEACQMRLPVLYASKFKFIAGAATNSNNNCKRTTRSMRGAPSADNNNNDNNKDSWQHE